MRWTAGQSRTTSMWVILSQMVAFLFARAEWKLVLYFADKRGT